MARPRIPIHPALKFLQPYLGAYKSAITREDRMNEYIDMELMTDGFGGSFEAGLLTIFELLQKWQESVDSHRAQRVLRRYIENALVGDYGDWLRVVNCFECGNEFRPNHGIEYALAVLEYEGPVCVSCRNRA